MKMMNAMRACKRCAEHAINNILTYKIIVKNTMYRRMYLLILAIGIATLCGTECHIHVATLIYARKTKNSIAGNGWEQQVARMWLG